MGLDRPDECNCTCVEPMTCRGECGCKYCWDSTPSSPSILDLNLGFCQHCKHLICDSQCSNYTKQQAIYKYVLRKLEEQRRGPESDLPVQEETDA